LSPEEFAYYEHAFATCTGYQDLTIRVYSKMFGHLFKDDHEMMRYIATGGRLN